jgi:hypothetical protein
MANTSYYIWLLVFGIVAYICILDENVPKFLYLILQMIRIWIVRFFWGIRLRAGLEFQTWKMKRDMKKWIKNKEQERG